MASASTAPTSSHISQSPDDQRFALSKDYNNDVFASASHESSSSIRKPLNSFVTDDEEDIEHGVVERPQVKRSWWSRKDIWTVRKRRRPSLDTETYTELRDNGTKQTRRKRTLYNCYVIGGIGGLVVLSVPCATPFSANILSAFLLVRHFFLGAATLSWKLDFEHLLDNWGKPGTTTEELRWYPGDLTRNIKPIACHSHNDYWRKVPLFSALRVGCTGVEADVWLFDEELYVGHNTASLSRKRTLRSLYIDPLIKIIEDQNTETDFYNGTTNGVYDFEPAQSLTLLVDLKTGGAETWPWVMKQVQPLRDRGWLSFVDENGKVHKRPITLVGTGNTPFELLTANLTYRDAFFDAPLETMLETSTNDSLAYEHLDATQYNKWNSHYASMRFKVAVGRIRRGKLSKKQIEIIQGHVRGAHRRGLKVRYWDLPAWPIALRNHVWDVLIKEGADLLNVDDLEAVSQQLW